MKGGEIGAFKVESGAGEDFFVGGERGVPEVILEGGWERLGAEGWIDPEVGVPFLKSEIREAKGVLDKEGPVGEEGERAAVVR